MFPSLAEKVFLCPPLITFFHHIISFLCLPSKENNEGDECLQNLDGGLDPSDWLCNVIKKNKRQKNWNVLLTFPLSSISKITGDL